MTFISILFKDGEDGITIDTREAPAYFADLNLDQIVDAVTAGRQDYDLKPLFYTSLYDIDAIRYRQEVFRDLEGESLYAQVSAFAQQMRAMRAHLAQAAKLHYKYQKERWFLEAVNIYCDAVNCLAQGLTLAELKSRGFVAFRQYVASYAESDRFALLQSDTKMLLADLAEVKYCLHIKGNRIHVRQDESETDYSAEVEKTFEKFKQGAVKDYRVAFSNLPDMNHVEAQILDFVAQLYPGLFSNLDLYCTNNGNFLDEAISVYDREVQFYIAWLEYLAIFKRAGLEFCYPQISNTRKEVYDYEGFDLALACKLIRENSSIVCNDFYLKGKERIFVVSGPNQGGKTTFARTFGQLHYLAAIGCPVPGREARLFLFDRLLTHFEKEEDIQSLRGKLQDDLVRIYNILNQSTSNSIIVINEIFTSTTLQDAMFLSKKVMETIMDLDLLCVCVTFIDELASLGEKTVSMVSTIVPGNPALRTYKIVRRPADGLSYAISIAEKYRLTYDCLQERIRS